MTSAARATHWDIFCQVIDNYGDIGVCWRLARQLTKEHGLAVRLWVDALDAFARICPQVDARLDRQTLSGVEVRRWAGNGHFADAGCPVPGAVVVEAFACQLPEHFIAAMASCEPRPVWINLEYLSAETWAVDWHALPSPHPRLPLTKYFFFPGFSDASGGLLRESGLEASRLAYCAESEEKADFWRSMGGPTPADAFVVSLFAYENAAIEKLLAAWERSSVPVCCLLPKTQTLPQIETCVGHALAAGDIVRRGQLEIRVLAFVPQDAYDRLLWSCDLNLVRGEDSFVRAQWAARPLLWHIYAQSEDAHLAKLEAFLDLYCAGLTVPAADAVRRLHRAWNGDPGLLSAELWARWYAELPELREHAARWANRLAAQQDLCSRLVRFCRSKL